MGMRPLDRYPTLLADAVVNFKEGGQIFRPLKSGAGYRF
ncbi:MAG: hypothetical protein IPI14_01985 [Polaromonas sp.]|nr:hypothetical protein [Polaromonas sp.]